MNETYEFCFYRIKLIKLFSIEKYKKIIICKQLLNKLDLILN